nr:VanZ family protein [Agrococcus sp. ARC_14]
MLAPEPLANVVLLVPFALLVGVAVGRPLLGALAGAVAGAALSAAIETVQALVPAIGRSCSTGDWLANTIGAGIGGLLALVALLLARSGHRARAGAPRIR